MRLRMLPHLVLKLVVGSFMLVHSLFMLMTYDTFLRELRDSITADSYLSNEFFLTVVSLVPFLEFTIGLMIIVGIYYRNAVLFCSVLLLFHLIFDLADLSLMNQFFIVISFVMSLFILFDLFTQQEMSHTKYRQL